MNPYEELLKNLERKCFVNPPRHCGKSCALAAMSFELSKIRIGLAIKNVIFNNPATIVFWLDGTKTVVKAENEPFDPEKGLAMAIVKKTLGNKGSYYNEFKKWLKNDG